MKQWMPAIVRSLRLLVLPVALFCLGCEKSEDDFDHDPPPGMGSLIINNTTDHGIYVYVDGVQFPDADYEDWRWYDMEPGIVRVVLVEHGPDDFTWAGDVDILLGRRTILDVSYGSAEQYDVNKWIK